MKIKTSELTGATLDWAVAKCEGRALRDAVYATIEEAAQRTVPFTMFSVDYGDDHKWAAHEITVTRFGCAPGCTLPSITAFRDGVPFNATVDMYFWTREEAELDCLISNEGGLENFTPSTDWTQGGPLIEREKINLMHAVPGSINYSLGILCTAHDYVRYMDGSTPLTAAMRCFVASKLGDEVDVPKELL